MSRQLEDFYPPIRDIGLATAKNATIGGTLTVTGATTSGGAITLTAAAASNVVPLTVTQNDTTNNLNAVAVTNAAAGSSAGLAVTSTGGSYGLNVTSTTTAPATNRPLVSVASAVSRTNSGTGLLLLQDSSTGATTELLTINTSGNGATGPAAVVTVAGATTKGVIINNSGTTNRESLGVSVSSLFTGTTNTSAVRLEMTNASSTGTLLYGLQSGSGAAAVFSGVSTNLLAVGPNATTNPTLAVDTSTASAATGLNVKGAAAAGGLAVSVLSSGTDETLTINAKGAGLVNLAGTSTGLTVLNRGPLKALIIGSTLTSIAAQNATPTAAQLLGGVIEHATVTGAGTVTLDTGTNISTAVTGAAVGDVFTCVYSNTGTQTGTITTNTGLTLKGTAAVATAKNAILTFRNTGANTWAVYINVSA